MGIAKEICICTVPTLFLAQISISGSPIGPLAKEPTSVLLMSKDQRGFEVPLALTLLVLTLNSVPHLP